MIIPPFNISLPFMAFDPSEIHHLILLISVLITVRRCILFREEAGSTFRKAR
jgi:hypothetical protein